MKKDNLVQQMANAYSKLTPENKAKAAAFIAALKCGNKEKENEVLNAPDYKAWEAQQKAQ